MAVSVRLSRRGRRHIPHFFIVVQDKKKSPKAAYIEKLGFYNPAVNPIELKLDIKRLNEWIKNGAEVSERVKTLAKIVDQGGPKEKPERKGKKLAGKFVEEKEEKNNAKPVDEEADSKSKDETEDSKKEENQ